MFNAGEEYFCNHKRWAKLTEPNIIVMASCKAKAIKLLKCTKKECAEINNNGKFKR